KTARSFDRHYCATADEVLRYSNGVAGARLAGDDKAELRAAIRTRDCLGMEAAIVRRLILSSTRSAEREARHGCVGAVIRDFGDDAQPRTAVGAVGERITEAPRTRLHNFRRTGRA